MSYITIKLSKRELLEAVREAWLNEEISFADLIVGNPDEIVDDIGAEKAREIADGLLKQIEKREHGGGS